MVSISPECLNIAASDVVLYVAGVNGGGGGPNDLPAAATTGRDSTVLANFYAANGTLLIDKATDATGAFLGRDVRVDTDVDLTLDSFFINRPPVADPQTVSTDNATSIVILLTGSDPEGGDLTFGILGDGCPTCTGPDGLVGSLSGLAEITPAPAGGERK